ncbi:uncharacterized protein NFIA_043660 [Aspergillus fischeri NRRL 181]|uniref:FAD dependent oxidoreductase n=1 Tax=Neosartorya fischeri (strain ATCC 1020 / DSM 3700 / CBS 544.65 / FGSC A1164 / JCM 1740 / NRRL 181 / WB 181) TaxID=331117 RepID=A1CUX0_NEOFI|nr:conserved hypothetical protein [Aspergillus fischeri NRRL 181]EAW25547.1 conserved hypothetical protein [Aspergillus fischeri NRRL 181]KAG2001363.1 hypothetical protein GB937_010202 [Aspergillus fischeri]
MRVDAIFVPSFLVTLLGCATALASTGPDIDPPQFDSDPIIRDFCIIGGGSSGTYTAIKLRQTGHSVALVEKEPLLGGHTNTYHDPISGKYIDYGVIVYEDIPEVRDYFAHFNIPTAIEVFSGLTESVLVDLHTGVSVSSPPGNKTEAMMRYKEQLAKYPYLSDGWDLPDPVPGDLLLPFGDFIEKYDLGPAVETLTGFFQGVGDWLSYPTVYIMKSFTPAVANGIENGYLVTTEHNNGALYQAAREELGDDALLSSRIVAMSRSSNDLHQILVQTPNGLRLIRAKKTIITVPPIVKILENFDLDDHERAIFGQFNYSHHYTTLTKITGLPAGKQILNRGEDTLHNLPHLPGIYAITPTVMPEFYALNYGGWEGMREDEVRNRIRDDVLKLRVAGYNISEPEILAFNNHCPFELFVSGEQIANGFYRDLYALQGHRNTYYAGAAFHTHDSSALWKFVWDMLRNIA